MKLTLRKEGKNTEKGEKNGAKGHFYLVCGFFFFYGVAAGCSRCLKTDKCGEQLVWFERKEKNEPDIFSTFTEVLLLQQE